MGKRQELRRKRELQSRKKKIIILSSIFTVAILFSVVLIVNANKPIGEILPPQERIHPNPDQLSLGDPNAPVVVEEFSDFQCVACAQFWETMEPDFINKYVETGLVYFKYKPFSFIGPESFQAAEAAYCANDQGAFWQYHDILFTNWDGENTGNFSDKRLTAFADQIGLKMDTFESCFNKNTYQNQVRNDVVYGQGVGVTGTPSFLVNGTLVYSNDLYTTIDSFLGK